MQQKRFLTLTLGFVGILTLVSLNSCNKNTTSTDTKPNTNTPPVITNTDIDGNHYDTVRIGKQLWMVQPLKVTRYNDGTPISYIVNGNDWAATTTGARCYYGTNVVGTAISTSDSAKYAATYGALYNWYAVNHKSADGKPNLAPKGWHIADTTEWNTLIGTLNGNPNFTGGNDSTVGGKLKDTGTIEAGTGHWYAPNAGATNSSHFKALPAGYRDHNGFFNYLGTLAYFWSSTEYASSTTAWYRFLDCDNAGIYRYRSSKLLSLSVVCVRD